MKKIYLILVLVILICGILFIRFGTGEDSWIKDSRGVWVKHGNPSEVPDYVLEQQEVITCAVELFENFEGEINSQCLGICGNYAVDIVHVPRTEEDDFVDNQCEFYINGEVTNFIELDANGKIVRIE